MLILPPGHGQTIREPPVFRRRERAMLAGVSLIVAALALALVVSLASPERHSGHGCVAVGLGYSTGGTQIYRCGSGARALCATVGQANGPVGAAARAISSECRKAGLPVG